MSLSCSSEQLDGGTGWHCELRRQTIPKFFAIGQGYPSGTEGAASPTTSLPIDQGSPRFEDLLTYNNTQAFFSTNASLVMPKRLFALLEYLARAYYAVYGVKLYVTKSWTNRREDETFISSLHYEGENGTRSFNHNALSCIMCKSHCTMQAEAYASRSTKKMPPNC